jgi:uncharacterized protein YkwD
MRAGTYLLAGFLALGAHAAQAGQCLVPGNAGAIESAMIAALNDIRARQGLTRLSENRDLAQAAINHACDMGVNGFFDHQGSDGSSVQARARAEGFSDCLIAENIAWGYPDPSQIMTGWMNSSGHRQNMLLPRAREVGMAVAQGADGPVWVLVIGRSC